jgi:membrane protein
MSDQKISIAMRIESLKDLLERHMAPPSPDDSTLRKLALRAFQVSFAVARDLTQGQLSLRAMSLVYYTVISFIPLLALTFSVLKGLGAHNTMEPALLNLLSPLGERSGEITRNIIMFVENVRVDVLGFVSLGVLLYSVLNMMQKIEAAFNFIWSVSEGRKLATRISDYLFALIVSPLLIFISVGITSSLNTNFFALYIETLSFGGTILEIFGTVVAFLFMSMAFAFAYRFIPNTRVRFGPAFIGGMMTTVIWKAMGMIFQSFFASSSSNEIIYVAFFSIILVMIFVYLGWLVLLTGSSIAYYIQNPGRIRTGRQRLRLSIAEHESSVLSVAYLIVERFQKQQTPWSANELTNYLQLNGIIVDDVIDTLLGIGFIIPTNQDPQRYLPAGAVDDRTIQSVWRQLRHYIPDPFIRSKHIRTIKPVQDFLDNMEERVTEHLGTETFYSPPLEEKTAPKAKQD